MDRRDDREYRKEGVHEERADTTRPIRKPSQKAYDHGEESEVVAKRDSVPRCHIEVACLSEDHDGAQNHRVVPHSDVKHDRAEFGPKT